MDLKNKSYLQIILAQILFSFMYLFVRYVESFGVYNLAFARVFLTVIFLGIISLIYKKYSLQVPTKQKLKLLFFGAIHGFILLASYLSIYLLSISSAMLIQATMPIWIAILAVFILGEKLDRKTILAIVISFMGLVILLYDGKMGTRLNILGVISALFVAVFGGLVYVLSKTFKEYSGFSLTFWQNLIAIPFLIPLLFIQKPIFNISNSIFVVLIALGGMFGFILVYTGIRNIKASHAGVLSLLNYVLTIILAMIFLLEFPSLKELVGGILIIYGVYVVLTAKNS